MVNIWLHTFCLTVSAWSFSWNFTFQWVNKLFHINQSDFKLFFFPVSLLLVYLVSLKDFLHKLKIVCLLCLVVVFYMIAVFTVELP